MSVVMLDQASSSKLAGHHTPVMVCDDTGRVLGHFVPATAPNQSIREPELSEEELVKRESRTTGRTLSEIIADLGRRQ